MVLQDCLAEELSKWLECALTKLSIDRDVKVLVVALVGKDAQSQSHSSVDCLNAMLNRQVFLNRWAIDRSKNKKAQIDAYYDASCECIFLHLTGMYDLNSSSAMMAFSEKGFYETIAELESNYMRLLHLLTIISHMIVFVEPCCRFDLSNARLLRNLNYIRQETLNVVLESIAKIPSIPKDWTNEGRLCSPRLIFAFYRNPLRADLGAVKRKELVDKLERSMEDQIYNILRKSRIVTNNRSASIGSIPTNSPFVHVFIPNEAPRDILKEVLDQLHDVNKPKLVDDEKRKKKRFDDGFSGFLSAHLDEARKDGFYDSAGKYIFEIPKLKTFIRVTSVLYKLLIIDSLPDTNFMNQLLNVEMEFSQSRSKKMLPMAFRTYEQDLPQFYPQQQHEIKLAQAIQYLTSQTRGPKLEETLKKLREKCEALWKDGRQACETLSLTGNHCSMQIHCLPSERNNTTIGDLPTSAHSSKARYLSTCNCGYTQDLRDDPFTIKEANFDFYERNDFACCRQLEKYEFPLFNPPDDFETTKTIVDGDDDEQRQRGKLFGRCDVIGPQSQPDVQSFDRSEVDVDMLLDRYNKLAIDSDSQLVIAPDTIDERKRIPDLLADSTRNRHDENEQVSTASSISDSAVHDDIIDPDADDLSDIDTANVAISAAPRKRSRTKKDDNVSDVSETSEVEDNNDDCCTEDIPSDSIQKRNSVVAGGSSLLLLSDEKFTKLKSKYEGLFLDGMPNNQCVQGLDPLFPSWSVTCLGSSSLRDMPNFSHGSQYLLPWDVTLKVDVDEWDRKMDLIATTMTNQKPRRPRKMGDTTEKVKVFVGFEYECPRGHRFMMQTPDKMLKHNAAGGPKDSAAILIRNDMPLWYPCSCRSAPRVNGQLMRLHIVTPKAPVAVTLNPRVEPNPDDGDHLCFHAGTRGLIQLVWGKYYVLRFPYCYVGPNGPIYPPKGPMMVGRVLKNSLGVIHSDV